MGITITKLRQRFVQASMPQRFIYVNVALFLLVWLVIVVLMLFNLDGSALQRWLELPAWPARFLRQPWSIVTYMFMHADVFHLLFNMLWLYWFGRLFLYLFSERHFCGLYFFGGLCGGALYMLCYNLFPYFSDRVQVAYLLGASASVLAITVATAVREPDLRVRLFLFGEIRLKYIALAMVGMDLLLMTSGNAGGHIAHLGGALSGWWFAVSLRKGRDITAWINRVIDVVVNLFTAIGKPRPRKPKMKVTYHFQENNAQRTASAPRKRSAEIDRILDKLKQSGYSSLTDEEKKSLFDASNRN